MPVLNHEVSAVQDALYASRDVDLTGAVLFASYFPSLEDLKLIVATGVSTIYFFGEINDANSVSLINNLASSSIPLEIIKLE